MAQLKVTLSIGYPAATRKDVIEVDDEDLAMCDTDEKKNELLEELWQDWANNHIEGGYELV